MKTRKPDPKSLTIKEAHTLANDISSLTDRDEGATAKLLLLCYALTYSDNNESLLTSVEEALAVWMPNFDEMRKGVMQDQLVKLRAGN